MQRFSKEQWSCGERWGQQYGWREWHLEITFGLAECSKDGISSTNELFWISALPMCFSLLRVANQFELFEIIFLETQRKSYNAVGTVCSLCLGLILIFFWSDFIDSSQRYLVLNFALVQLRCGSSEKKWCFLITAIFPTGNPVVNPIGFDTFWCF